VIVKDGAIVDTIGFSVRKGRTALFSLVTGNDAVGRHLTPEDWDRDYSYTKGCINFGSVLVKFSGRTERECASQSLG
jgi:hypothetical protein